MAWDEADILEKDIILTIQKKPLSITEIAKVIERAKPTVSEAVKRLMKQEIVVKTYEYGKDARKTKIQVNKKRVKIEKTHKFYLTYFFLSIIPFVISFVLSVIFKQYFLLIGCSMGILPPLLFILYEVYIKEDKVVVYKNPKPIKKEEEGDLENC